MAIQITVQGNLSRAKSLLAGIKNGANRAGVGAMERAAQMAETQAGRLASAEYHITKGSFMDAVSSSVKKSGHGGEVTLSVSFMGHMMTVLKYGARWSKDGLQVQVKRNGGTATVDRAFTAERYGSYTPLKRVGKERYPLKGVYGPSAAHILNNESVKEKMAQTISETYDRRLEHEITRLLNGWGR